MAQDPRASDEKSEGIAHCPLCRGRGVTFLFRLRQTARGSMVKAVRSASCQVCDGTGQSPRANPLTPLRIIRPRRTGQVQPKEGAADA